jgi:hypothetical protein
MPAILQLDLASLVRYPVAGCYVALVKTGMNVARLSGMVQPLLELVLAGNVNAPCQRPFESWVRCDLTPVL